MGFLDLFIKVLLNFQVLGDFLILSFSLILIYFPFSSLGKLSY